MMSLQQMLELGMKPDVINAAIGFIISWVVEAIPGFDTINSALRRLVVFALGFVVPLGCYGLMFAFNLPAPDIGVPLVAGMLAFVASQAAHARTLVTK